MIIVDPSAELLEITPNAEKLIEAAGRTCYKSEGEIEDGSAGKFIQMIIRRGHDSVLEHASATFRFTCDRGVSHEMVRHRLASYSQESTRYCNYGKEKHGGEIKVIEPPKLTEMQRGCWSMAMKGAERHYLRMLDEGCSPQIARSVLPNSLKTEIVMTCNLREWRHVFRLRTSDTAHPQIREVMLFALEILKDRCPNVFADFEIEKGNSNG